jgi:uncharacterized protein
MIRLVEWFIARVARWHASQIAMYLLGCVVFSLGAKFFIDSDLGTDPLDVLCIGITHHLPVSIGGAAAIVAIAFLVVWSAWNRKRPPLTPFVTTFGVGLLIDLWNILHLEQWTTPFLPASWILAIGLFLCSYGSALIIMSGIGIRIMDLVAITMIERWGWSFFRAKMSLEILLFGTGWLLGGPVGVGTLAFLALVGTLIQPFMWANNRFLSLRNHGIPSGFSRRARAG